MASFIPPEILLMGPGPSNVAPHVRQATARPTIGHLDPQFIALMDDIKLLLQYAFQTTNDLTIPVSAPGSAAMEASIVNLVQPDDVVVVCRNGAFGYRLAEMVRRAGGSVVAVDQPWGHAVDPEKLRDTLKATPQASLVAFVMAETSTGALSDTQTLTTIAHQHDCLVIVDAVTALAGSRLLVDEWQVDVVYAGTQKCLSAPPGLAPVSMNARAVQRLCDRTSPVRSWFLDLSLVMGYWGSGEQRSYHHTAPVNALYGLHEALLALRSEGLEASWERHQRHARTFALAAGHLGLEFLVPESARLPQLNCVLIPDGVDDAKVRQSLLGDHGIEIGAGLGELAGRVWRIGLMGETSRPDNILRLIRALAEVLTASGHSGDADQAIKAVETDLA